VAAVLSASRELPEQPRLADPGLPHQLDRGRAPIIEPGENLPEHTELLGAPDEVIGKQDHLSPSRPA
jgi:hypothetical protein